MAKEAAEGKQPELASAGAQAGKAAGQMQQAARSVQKGQRVPARQQGEQASRSLDPLGDQLQRRREELQREWRRQVVEAMDEALTETSRLAERQLRVQDELREGETPSPATRSEQGAIEEGVQKLLEQMKRAAGKNALVSPQIAGALGAAQQQMQQAREAISSAAPNSREAAEQAGGAVDALNSAAHQLIRAREDVSGSQSGSGLEEALERMAQLAQQQGGLGRQGAGLLPMAGTAAIREQLQRLAMRQRALAQELERMRGKGELGGAGQMAEEARACPSAGGRSSRPLGRGTARATVSSHARCRPNASGPRGRQKQRTAERDRHGRQRSPSAGASCPASGRRPATPGSDLGGAPATLPGGAPAGGGLFPPALRELNRQVPLDMPSRCIAQRA
jgi:hypothetical protein